MTNLSSNRKAVYTMYQVIFTLKNYSWINSLSLNFVKLISTGRVPSIKENNWMRSGNEAHYDPADPSSRWPNLSWEFKLNPRKYVLKSTFFYPQRLSGHQGPVTAIKFDRWHIITGSKDGYALAWSALGKHSRCLQALRHPKWVKQYMSGLAIKCVSSTVLFKCLHVAGCNGTREITLLGLSSDLWLVWSSSDWSAMNTITYLYL